jgi:hypothetical protein
MPVIFVHGVNNRREDLDFEPRRLVTQGLLEKHMAGATINGRKLGAGKPLFPYWGDLATSFAWGMKSLPEGNIDALGVPGVDGELRPLIALIRDALAHPAGAEDQPLLTLARQSFSTAVHVIGELVLLTAVSGEHEAAAHFVVAVQEYAARETGTPAWLAPLQTDEQFLATLISALKTSSAGSVQTLGVFDSMGNTLAKSAAKLKQATKAAADKVLDRVGDFASTKALAWGRSSLNATLGRFFGDVFVYLNGRGDRANPGPIPTLILKSWEDAIAHAPAEPIVIIGHSLGGVISFDLLSHFRSDLIVDLLVTVGSQVSHFEEMKLFRSSNRAIPDGITKRAPKPVNIKHWINVLDEIDIFSYACEAVFDGAQDLHYDTRTYVVKAHGAYFMQAPFYERLRKRIDALPAV